VSRARQLTDSIDSQRGRALIGLREMLLRGDFQPGEHIAEVPLGQRLGVSRTPARVALEMLAQEGLLQRVASGGFKAREFTVRDIWDALEARGVLEGAAARLAAERLADSRELEPVARIGDMLDRLVAPSLAERRPPTSDEMLRYGELNAEFHSAIVDLAKSPMLKWSLERIQSIPFASPRLVILSKLAENTIVAQAQHRAILDAIGNREGARAEGLVREHARFARHNLEFALAEPKTPDTSQSGLALIRSGSKHPAK
jgi:GntR family transcriptional regulator of vanillate catabolism